MRDGKADADPAGGAERDIAQRHATAKCNDRLPEDDGRPRRRRDVHRTCRPLQFGGGSLLAPLRAQRRSIDAREGKRVEFGIAISTTERESEDRDRKDHERYGEPKHVWNEQDEPGMDRRTEIANPCGQSCRNRELVREIADDGHERERQEQQTEDPANDRPRIGRKFSRHRDRTRR